MSWLGELIIELLAAFLPGQSRDDDRSIVGESSMDRRARWIGYGVLVFLIGVVVAFIL